MHVPKFDEKWPALFDRLEFSLKERGKDKVFGLAANRSLISHFFHDFQKIFIFLQNFFYIF